MNYTGASELLRLTQPKPQLMICGQLKVASWPENHQSPSRKRSNSKAHQKTTFSGEAFLQCMRPHIQCWMKTRYTTRKLHHDCLIKCKRFTFFHAVWPLVKTFATLETRWKQNSLMLWVGGCLLSWVPQRFPNQRQYSQTHVMLMQSQWDRSWTLV